MADRGEERGVALVTGAAGGIGAAIALRLARDGWTVVATDLAAPRLALPADALQLPLDVSDAAAVAALAARLADRPVAALVNAAGLFQDVVPFLDMDTALEARIFAVNYFGALACCRAFGRLMAARGRGAIVNVTSINEARPLPLHAYAPAKAALGAATALMAGDLGPLGIRVNAVAPGFTLTPTLKAKIESGARDASVLEAHAAQRRLVEPDEVAAATAFLLSDAASAVTGATLPVDAGWIATAHWMNFRDLGRNR